MEKSRETLKTTKEVDLKKIKKDLRKEVLESRGSFSSAYKQRAGEDIRKQILSTPEFAKAEKIFVYVSTEDEVDTRELIADMINLGKEVFVPRCKSFGLMELVKIKNFEALELGAYGILEPRKDIVGMDYLQGDFDVDITILPCVAASRGGKRLGYGGGFYDRFLQKSHSKKWVLCFGKLLLDAIPMEEHDQIADKVITEK